ALTRRSEHPAVPTVSALQQVPAEGYTRAVPRGEEQPLVLELGGQDTAVLAGPDNRDHPVGVDGAAVEPPDVQQQTPIANVVSGPAAPARTYRDAVAIRVGVAEGGDDVARVVSL